MAEATENIQYKLRNGKRKIGVWGTGFIGFSTMAYFAREGIQCIGYDIDNNRVARINDGETPVHYDMESWFGFNVAPLTEEGLLRATQDEEEIMSPDVPVHFISVPTERDGEPWGGALEQTVERIAEYETLPEEPLLLIVESTLTPGMTEDIVLPAVRDSPLALGEDVVVGVAPRRDWFISSDKTLENIPRVFGGQDQRTTEYMESVLGIVCNELEPAPDHNHAELIKSVENAYRHVGITLANQLDRAYPDIDMRTVLRLVGTKWNIPTYHPSVGIGGYCVPVASQYVLAGTEYEDELSILQQTIETDQEQPSVVADAIADHGVDTVTVLGLAYKGDLKVDVLSPTVPIVDSLQQHGIDVRVNDPFYSDQYIEERTGATSVAFPEGLDGTDAVVIVADHSHYSYLPNQRVVETLDSASLVVDNHAIWEDVPLEEHGIEYAYTGAEGWLSSP